MLRLPCFKFFNFFYRIHERAIFFCAIFGLSCSEIVAQNSLSFGPNTQFDNSLFSKDGNFYGGVGFSATYKNSLSKNFGFRCTTGYAHFIDGSYPEGSRGISDFLYLRPGLEYGVFKNRLFPYLEAGLGYTWFPTMQKSLNFSFDYGVLYRIPLKNETYLNFFLSYTYIPEDKEERLDYNAWYQFGIQYSVQLGRKNNN
jgi:hypothetical protein